MADELIQSVEKATQQTTIATSEVEHAHGDDLAGLKNNRDDWRKKAEKAQRKLDEITSDAEKANKQKMIDEGKKDELLEIERKEKAELKIKLRNNSLQLAVVNELIDPADVVLFAAQINEDLSNIADVVSDQRAKKPYLFKSITETKEPVKDLYKDLKPATLSAGHVFTQAEVNEGVKIPGWWAKNREAILAQKIIK